MHCAERDVTIFCFYQFEMEENRLHYVKLMLMLVPDSYGYLLFYPEWVTVITCSPKPSNPTLYIRR